MSTVPSLANDKYRATLRSTYIDGVDTTLNVTAIPTNLPTIIVIGWNTQYETLFRIEGTSGTNSSNYALTGITKLRGYSGNLPENLAVNCLNNEEFFNQYSTAIISAEGLKGMIFADDLASNDTYAATVASFPTAYDDVTGVPIMFRANTANTGAATLNINSIAAGDIKKYKDGVLSALETGDILADNIYLLSWDGDRFILMSPSSTTTSTTDGWTPSSDTWVYVSASTFKITGADRTAIFTKGTRLKFTNTTLKYAVVVASSFSTDTTVTIAVNTDYVIANAAISSPYYSYQASPAGYPDFFAYTPTWTGFSVNPTDSSTNRFSVTGKTCHVFRSSGGDGTSNATTITISLPVASNKDYRGMCIVRNNSTAITTPGLIAFSAADSVAQIGLNLSAVGGFASSNGKDITGFDISYEI